MDDWTPGPWVYDGPDAGGYIWKGNPKDGKPVAQVRGWGWLSKAEGASITQDANAHLIAAAPELAEALQNLVGLAEKQGTGLRHYKAALDTARAALAKARGGGDAGTDS